MKLLDRGKLLAEIAKLGAEVYGIVIDKKIAQGNGDKDRRIATLEAEIADLKRRLS